MTHEGPAGVVERWQPELDKLAPPTPEGLSHLLLRWEPGEEWAPVHRWFIWECSPAHRAPLQIYDELRGPNPRNFGRWNRVLKTFERRRSFKISMRQWLIYRETGFFAKPLWVVQGDRGGHKRYWDGAEASVSRMYGGPQEPPVPGELPYAEPSRRTIEKLQALDRVRRYGAVLHLYEDRPKLHARLDRMEREKLHAMAAQLWEWMDVQLESRLTFTRAQASEVWGAASDKPMPDMERGKEEFIEQVAATATI